MNPYPELSITFTFNPVADDPDPLCSATTGLLVIKAQDRNLTALISGGQLQAGPCVAGYPLAEWLCWNWYRLRWETKPPAREPDWNWLSAHSLGAIGHGYIWPPITVAGTPGGKSVLLTADPHQNNQGAQTLHYLGAPEPIAVSVAAWEQAVDQFVTEVIARLERHSCQETNLHQLWTDLQAERKDPELHQLRIAEARLGLEPGPAEAETALTGP